MHLPHVTPFAKDPIYFFTMCVAGRRPILANAPTCDFLQSLWKNSGMRDGWFVGRFVIMPDHVHFFAQPSRVAQSRPDWMKMLKSVSARQIAKRLGLPPPLWQADTFDHILRNSKSYGTKWDYVRENPVRKGLVSRSEDWPWQGEIESLMF